MMFFSKPNCWVPANRSIPALLDEMPQLFHEDGSSVNALPPMARLNHPRLRSMCKWPSRTGTGLWFPVFYFVRDASARNSVKMIRFPCWMYWRSKQQKENSVKLLTEWTTWYFHHGRYCFHPLWNHWTSFGAIAISLGNLSGHEGFALHRGDYSGLFPCILSKHWHPCTWWVHQLVVLVMVPIWSWFHCSSALL